jgi:hypothetical protein
MTPDFPGRNQVHVPRRKVTGYLLAAAHPVGGPKARYFLSRGYSLEAPEVLEAALRDVASQGTVVSEEATTWGRKYLVVGQVRAPDGNPMDVATVWVVAGNAAPVLVTAYPNRRNDERA